MGEKDKQETREIVTLLQGMKQEDRLMAKGVIMGLVIARGGIEAAETAEKTA